MSSFLPKNTTLSTPGLKPKPLDPESSMLTTRSLHLPHLVVLFYVLRDVVTSKHLGLLIFCIIWTHQSCQNLFVKKMSKKLCWVMPTEAQINVISLFICSSVCGETVVTFPSLVVKSQKRKELVRQLIFNAWKKTSLLTILRMSGMWFTAMKTPGLILS